MSEQIKQYYQHSYNNQKPAFHEWTAGTANPELVNLVYENKIKPNSKILEIGCGLGTESVFLAIRGMDVTAIDIAESALSTAKKFSDAYEVNVNWKVADILSVQLDEKYDVITDQGCFHHLTDDERAKYVKQISKFLKDDGMFILRCFSDKIEPGNQPRRITSNELLGTFYPTFKLEHLEHVLSFSTPTRKSPLGWFSIWYKNK